MSVPPSDLVLKDPFKHLHMSNLYLNACLSGLFGSDLRSCVYRDMLPSLHADLYRLLTDLELDINKNGRSKKQMDQLVDQIRQSVHVMLHVYKNESPERQ